MKYKKIKIGELYKLTKECVKWHYDHADIINSVGGVIRVETHEDLMSYGLDKFAYSNNLNVYALVERDNGHDDYSFAYRCYIFNELGEAWHWFSPESLEKL